MFGEEYKAHGHVPLIFCWIIWYSCQSSNLTTVPDVPTIVAPCWTCKNNLRLSHLQSGYGPLWRDHYGATAMVQGFKLKIRSEKVWHCYLIIYVFFCIVRQLHESISVIYPFIPPNPDKSVLIRLNMHTLFPSKICIWLAI